MACSAVALVFVGRRESLGLDPRLVQNVEACHRGVEIVCLDDPLGLQLIDDVRAHAQLGRRDHDQLVARK